MASGIPQIPAEGESLPFRADEQLLATLASAMFSALPQGAGQQGAAPQGIAPQPAEAGGGAPAPAAATPPVLANVEGELPHYQHLPAIDAPVQAAPPPLSGAGRPVAAPDFRDLLLLDTMGQGGTGPGGLGSDPISLLPPATFGTGGIGAIAAEPADALYFIPANPGQPHPVPAPDDSFAPQPALAGQSGVPASTAPAAKPAATAPGETLDPRRLRADFPILSERVGGKPLIWLDNGATTQKPQAVIDRLAYYYAHENSNIHRAAHELAARSTDAYEGARETVRKFLNAPSTDNIVFTRGTTEAINLVAQSWGRQNLEAGDAIILSQLEHHANIVPWVRLSQELGFTIRIAPVDDRGDIRLDEYARLLDGSVKLVAFTQVSNALGTVTPAKTMIELAHGAGALVLLDGAQSVSHMPVDVQALNPDFFVFSGHKIYGPTGIGALYGREAILDAMPPWQGGGNMIEDVTFEAIRYHGAPMKFEAGTGNIADAVGLGTALDYVLAVGREAICAHEHALIAYTEYQFRQIPGLRIIGEPAMRAGVVSFVMDRCSVPDIGKALSREGIAVRAGHHCAQPILRRMGVEATVRPSFGLYNIFEDIDAVVRVLRTL